MEVIPLTDFQHGPKTFAQGVPADIPELLANDLERAGLVRVKMAPTLTNKMQPDAEPTPGKAQADGGGTPSASLPVAQVSPETIAQPLKRGRGRPRTKGT